MHSVKLKLVFLLFSFQAVIGKGVISTEPNASASDTSEAKAIKNYNWYPNNAQADYGTYSTHQQLSPRDSYTNAASEMGYAVPGTSPGHVHSQYASPQPYPSSEPGTAYAKPIMYHYKVYPSVHKSAYGNARDSPYYDVPKPSYEPQSTYNQKPSYDSEYGMEEGDNGEEGGGLGGLVGLVGLLGLKGLKALKFWGILPFLPLLLPLLLPILIIPIGLGIVAALFIPIPLLVVPGRSFPQTARVAKALALSEDCIERITCETARFARGYGFDSAWIDKFLERTSTSSNSKWIEKVSRGAKSIECKQYTCNPLATFKKSMKMVKSEST